MSCRIVAHGAYLYTSAMNTFRASRREGVPLRRASRHVGTDIISFLIFIEVVEIESLVRLLCMFMQANSLNVSLATPPDAPQLDSCSRVSIQKRLARSYVKGTVRAIADT